MLVYNSKTNRPVLKRKYIQGKGFTDSLLSSLRSVGSYIAQNKDLIAKPLLGAVGDLAATGISQGVPALINYINNKNKKGKKESTATPNKNVLPTLDANSIAILESLMRDSTNSNNTTPLTNIIGSGIKRF
jgi:hypothetical protein